MEYNQSILRHPEYYVGYKGTNMCTRCDFCSVKIIEGKKIFECGHYNTLCKNVARRCSGIKVLRLTKSDRRKRRLDL